MSVFKARKFETSRTTTPQSSTHKIVGDVLDSRSETATPSGVYSGVELTKNDKYCVSRLPSLPPLLKELEADSIDENNNADLWNGYTDNVTKCALVISEKAINVWPYDSTDETPLTFEFPIQKGSQDHMQLAILTPPAPGTMLDPGLVIIDAITGQVRFYESVQHAPALGLIKSALIETEINMKHDEYITLAENVEPAGIVVATSLKRVVLISLRDSKGAPHLSTVELTQPSASSKLTSWFSGSIGHAFSDDIVSIKSGKVLNHGSCQEILVQDASGTFKKYFYQSSSTGAPFINHKKNLSYRLASYLENNIDASIPGTVYDLKFHDLWPLPQDSEGDDDLFVALVGVQSSMTDFYGKSFYLVTMKINDTGVLVLGSHSLPTSNIPMVDDAASKIKMYLPKPGKTAFVVIGNSVILADLNSNLTASQFPYYSPKWSDVINFKSSLNVIGIGYEDEANGMNSALVFITAGYGVVRIEKFDTTSSQSIGDGADSTDEVSSLISRIQQAIYYSDSALVDFDLGETNSSKDATMSAINGVISSVLNSSSPHLPPLFPSTRDSLSVRIKLSKELISFTKRNFSAYEDEALPPIVEALEKLEVASSLWHVFDTDSGTAYKHILKDAISKTEFAKSCTSKDLIRSFFTKGLKEILPVWTSVLERLRDAGTSSKFMTSLLVKTLYDSVYQIEKKYIGADQVGARRRLWIDHSNLVVIAEQMYSEYFCSQTDELKVLITPEDRSNLLSLTTALYFCVCRMISYQQDTYGSDLEKTIKWYQNRKSSWIDALLKRGLVKEALALAEEYYDFSSVAYILEKEREQTSPEYIQDRIDYYMKQYGYDFASKLFDFVISRDKPIMFFVDLKPYKSFIETYFQKNQRKSNKVSWIHYLLNEEFEKTAQVLLQSSFHKEVDSQANRELNYSVAKLAAVAANVGQTDVAKSDFLREYAQEAEQNLIAIRIQNKLHHEVLQYVQDHEALVTLEYFMKNFGNKDLDASEVEKSIQPFFQDFVDQRPLSKDQLIELLTSIAPRGAFEDVFADALIIAESSYNESHSKNEAFTIWKKLLCIDDWKSITSTSDHTDNVTKFRVKETVMYKTLQRLIGHDLQSLKELLVVAKKQAAHNKLDVYIQELLVQYNVDDWVAAILEGGV